MAFGSLVHHLILEPESFEQYYFVADKPKRNTKGKAAYHRLDQERGQRKWVTQEEFLQAQEMRYNLAKNKLVQVILTGVQAQQTVFWRDSQSMFYARPKRII